MTVRAPAGLQAAGKAAFRRALASVETSGEAPELMVDAIVRYARAVDDAAYCRRVWVAKGRQLTSESNNGQNLGRHPLLVAMEDADARAARFGYSLGLDLISARRLAPPGARGRPVGSQSAPDRRDAPAPPRAAAVGDGPPPVTLRSVK